MTHDEISKWIRETADICSHYFDPKYMNVHISVFENSWCVGIASPKIWVSEKDLATAMEKARKELTGHISAHKNLARTLGIESAE